MDLSVIIPIKDERENLSPLCEQLREALAPLDCSYEVIFVDDGSMDGSFALLEKLAAADRRVKVVRLRRNFGQTAALQAGIDWSSGEILVTLDGDLQNDPADIPCLLEKLAEGYDAVLGQRAKRQDHVFIRKIPSLMGNWLIRKVTGVHIKDMGCTLRAMRRDLAEALPLYGEMHRFVPIYAKWMGAEITEIPVKHHPRKFGSSKYGLERVFKVILDLIVVMFLHRYFVKPIYIFGGFGLLSFALSGISFALMLYLKLAQGVSLILTPLPLLTALTFLVGFISILLGLLAEMLVRIYFESQGRAAYLVREQFNFTDSR